MYADQVTSEENDDFDKYYNQYRPKHKFDFSPAPSSYYSTYSSIGGYGNNNSGRHQYNNNNDTDVDTYSSGSSSINR